MPTVIVARTDSLAADLITSDVDERDQPFLTGERTVEGFFRTKPGIDTVLARGHAYAMEVLSFGFAGGMVEGDQQFALMGIGVWLAIVMFLNVWGIIWPNQKRALGIVPAEDDAKAKAARLAMLASRTNLLLSLPMLTSMAMYQTLFG